MSPRRGLRHRRRVLHRRDGLPAPRPGRVPDPDRPRVVRRGRRGRRRGRRRLGRAPGDRRHDARMRHVPPLSARAPARLRDRFEVGIRGGFPGALAEQLAVPGDVAARPARRGRRRLGALVEPGGNALRAARAAGLSPGTARSCSVPARSACSSHSSRRPKAPRCICWAGRRPSLAFARDSRLRRRLGRRRPPGPAVRRRRRRVQRRRPAGPSPRARRARQAGRLHRPGRARRA